MSGYDRKEDSPFRKPPVMPPDSDYKYKQFLQRQKGLRCTYSGKTVKACDNEYIGIALFGTGRIGNLYLQLLHRNPVVKLLYIVESTEKTIQQVQKQYESRKATVLHYDQRDVAFKDEKVQGIVIATPTSTHEEIVQEALSHKKAVLCENMVANDGDAIKKLYEEAKMNNLVLLSGLNRRFDPSVKNIYQRIQNHEIGKLQMVKTVNRICPLQSLEVLKNTAMTDELGIHDIDMICWILGEFPVKVMAVGHGNIPEVRDNHGIDTGLVIMKFASGVVAEIDLARYSPYGCDQRLEVTGSSGLLQSNNEVPINVALMNDKGMSCPPMYHSFVSRYRDSYLYQLDHFLDCVQGVDKPIILAEETVAVKRVAMAAEISLHTSNCVTLNWDSDDFSSLVKLHHGTTSPARRNSHDFRRNSHDDRSRNHFSKLGAPRRGSYDVFPEALH